MATHSSVLAWRIPGMGEPGGLRSLGLHRVGHDWSDLAAAAAAETARICSLTSRSQASMLSLFKFVLLLLVHCPLAPCIQPSPVLGVKAARGPGICLQPRCPRSETNITPIPLLFFFETWYLFWHENNWFSMVCFFYVQPIISFIHISQCI